MNELSGRKRGKIKVPVEVFALHFNVIHAIALSLPLTAGSFFLASTHDELETTAQNEYIQISKFMSYRGFDSGGLKAANHKLWIESCLLTNAKPEDLF